MTPALREVLAGHLAERDVVPAALGQSGATILRLVGHGPDLFLKYAEGHVAELIRDEAARLRWLAGRVPVARLVDAGEMQGNAWLLTEAVAGRPAGDWIKADRARGPAVAAAIAGFMQALHALPVEDCPFDASVAGWLPLVRRYVAEGLVDEDDFDDEHDGWSAAEVLAKVEALAHRARGRVVVHGDLSLGNLLLDEELRVTGCIDVGRLGVGDPYRDVTIAWRDLGGFGAAAQAAFVAALGTGPLDPKRLELHLALDELF